MLSYEFFEATQFRKNKEDQIRCGSRPEWKGEPRRENDTHGGEPAFKSIGDGGGGAHEGAVADRRPQIGEVAGWRRRGQLTAATRRVQGKCEDALLSGFCWTRSVSPPTGQGEKMGAKRCRLMWNLW
ncbi:hypothetical protein BHE74_00016015 [Ensete ventricosum]|nr:hypothetical protein BHE74_00016015 [Ensete ventricosum]